MIARSAFWSELDRLLQGIDTVADRPKIGLEKESLRVGADGRLATTDHPASLGSALTHPHITTDYAEALLEFVTPPVATSAATAHWLHEIHQFVYMHLQDEMLWATSMPCMVAGDDSIRLAQYGTSNPGLMKHVYRRGLGYRYGRVMQTIAGVHFNFSLAPSLLSMLHGSRGRRSPLEEFTSDLYFGLVRNFQRFGWLVCYLFGASPAVCKSFLPPNESRFEAFDYGTWFLPYATSLRMSDIGYKNKIQANLNISYNSLDEYVRSLTRAIEAPDPEYVAIGVKVDGEYRQLNANLLQIENEFYSFMRPKQLARAGEKPTLGLCRRGVAYVELRALDLCVFDPSGVNLPQLEFLEVFLTCCALADSPPITADEQHEIDDNQALVATSGRKPGLKLRRHGEEVLLTEWAHELISGLAGVAELLDRSYGSGSYRSAVTAQIQVAADADATPSARVLREMRQSGETFFQFARRLSEQHREFFRARPLAADRLDYFQALTAQSLAEQQRLESADTQDFDSYLADYFSQRATDTETG